MSCRRPVPLRTRQCVPLTQGAASGGRAGPDRLARHDGSAPHRAKRGSGPCFEGTCVSGAYRNPGTPQPLTRERKGTRLNERRATGGARADPAQCARAGPAPGVPRRPGESSAEQGGAAAECRAASPPRARRGPPTVRAPRRIPGLARRREPLCRDSKKRDYVCGAWDEGPVGTPGSQRGRRVRSLRNGRAGASRPALTGGGTEGRCAGESGVWSGAVSGDKWVVSDRCSQKTKGNTQGQMKPLGMIMARAKCSPRVGERECPRRGAAACHWVWRGRPRQM